MSAAAPAPTGGRSGLGLALDRLLARVAAGALRLLGATWRIAVEGESPLDRGVPAVGALWHRDLLVAAFLFRDRGIRVAVSRSRDGDRIAAVLTRLGFAAPARGSSTRGGSAALRGLLQALAEGRSAAVTTDGPRGPARRSKPGVVALAARSGAAIAPVGVTAHPALSFGSWDRMLLPLPFARVVCRFGELLPVPAPAEAPERARLLAELDRRLEQRPGT
jgi:lysophospholipid acyltransferase (LPLAT)-like uncharacterized protein